MPTSLGEVIDVGGVIMQSSEEAEERVVLSLAVPKAVGFGVGPQSGRFTPRSRIGQSSPLAEWYTVQLI